MKYFRSIEARHKTLLRWVFDSAVVAVSLLLCCHEWMGFHNSLFSRRFLSSELFFSFLLPKPCLKVMLSLPDLVSWCWLEEAFLLVPLTVPAQAFVELCWSGCLFQLMASFLLSLFLLGSALWCGLQHTVMVQGHAVLACEAGWYWNENAHGKEESSTASSKSCDGLR